MQTAGMPIKSYGQYSFYENNATYVPLSERYSIYDKWKLIVEFRIIRPRKLSLKRHEHNRGNLICT